MIKWVALTPDQIAGFQPRKDFESSASIFCKLRETGALDKLCVQGRAIAAVENDTVLAIATWLTPVVGVFDLGMWASDNIHEKRTGYLRFMRGAVKNLVEMSHTAVRRIQTTSYADEVHDRWMKWLGFECEGTLKKYAPDGRDIRVWAITEV
jgi:hypothetical protein